MLYEFFLMINLMSHYYGSPLWFKSITESRKFFVLYLQIVVLDKTPPHIVTKGTPSTVEYLQTNQYGIYLTSKDLQASDPDSPYQELEFIITRPPHFGYLENAITGRCTE